MPKKPNRTHLYAAYGMNTSLESMADRCPAAVPYRGNPRESTGVIKNHYLTFNRVADVRRPVRGKADTVQVALWTVTDDCIAALDIFEGYPRFYTRRLVNVWTAESQRPFRALIYVMTDSKSIGLPYAEYYDEVTYGYRDFGIPVSQLRNAVSEIIRKSSSPQTAHEYWQQMEGCKSLY